MIDLNGMTKELGDFRRKVGLPQGNYEYSFLGAIGETIEAYNSHVEGDESNLGEELADVIIFILDVADQKNINIEEELTKKLEKVRKRKYVERNGYVVKDRKGS